MSITLNGRTIRSHSDLQLSGTNCILNTRGQLAVADARTHVIDRSMLAFIRIPPRTKSLKRINATNQLAGASQPVQNLIANVIR